MGIKYDAKDVGQLPSSTSWTSSIHLDIKSISSGHNKRTRAVSITIRLLYIDQPIDVLIVV